MAIGYLSLQSPTEYISGNKVVLPDRLEANNGAMQGWSANMAGYISGLENRLEDLEKLIKWTAETYPEVILGYKAVKDVEESVK